MTRTVFALFVDVMGVQQALLSTNDRLDAPSGFDRCRERLGDFHRDLSYLIVNELPLLLNNSPEIPEPDFVAEFSDSAYIIGERFASVAIPAIYLMRRALRHEYPLRGGIGVGTFSHETSGVRADQNRQVWTTSSFLGAAVVTAYHAERSITPGLRVLIHPLVMRRNTEAYLNAYTLSLPASEQNADSTHELRFWRNAEADDAALRLRAFRDQQNLSERAMRHYDAAITAYERFRATKKDLPHITPAIWL
jgi:hypothetical protein